MFLTNNSLHILGLLFIIVYLNNVHITTHESYRMLPKRKTWYAALSVVIVVGSGRGCSAHQEVVQLYLLFGTELSIRCGVL